MTARIGGEALVGLVLRPLTLGYLVGVAVLAGVFAFLCSGVALLALGSTDAAFAPARVEVLVVVLGAASVAAIVASYTNELARCRFSWTLPGLMRGLRLGGVQVALGVAALAATLFAIRSGAAFGAAGAAGLALVGFGLGLPLAESRPVRPVSLLALGLLAGAVLAAGLLAELAAAYPFAVLVAGAGLAAGSISGLTGVRLRRARIEAAPEDFAVWDEHPGDARARQLARLDDRNGGRGWSGGPIDDTPTRARALFHEEMGGLRGEWVGAMVRLAGLYGVLTVATLLAFGAAEGGTLANGVAWVWQGLVDSRARVEGLVGNPSTGGAAPLVAMTVVFGGMFTGLDFRRGVHYVMSRAQRAEAVWLASLRQTFVLMGALSVGLGAAAGLARLASDLDLELNGVPDIVGCVALTTCLMPAYQWTRVRYLGASGWLSDPSRWTLALTLIAALFAGLQGFLLVGWRELDAGPQVAALVLSPLAFALVQVAYRRALARWFARADLV